MTRFLLAAPLLALATAAAATPIPMFNATCGDSTDVHADEGGPVYINGHQAKLKKYNSKHYDAIHASVTVSFSINPDGSVMASYTGKHGANGICTVQEDAAASGECPPDVSEANRYQYPACN